MRSKSNYWVNFWKTYGKTTQEMGEQIQVLRTLNKNPITPELWEFTLKGINEQLKPETEDTILELCSGNGLITRYLSKKCRKITAVDISEDLLKILNSSGQTNIETIVSDIREIAFEAQTFSKVIIYAGVQYLSYVETIKLFERVNHWLKPGGIFFLGDVPYYQKKWNFYNTPERQRIYFNNLKDSKPIVGTWFDPDFFEKLGVYSGFKHTKLIPQHPDLIYSGFRFDYKLVK